MKSFVVLPDPHSSLWACHCYLSALSFQNVCANVRVWYGPFYPLYLYALHTPLHLVFSPLNTYRSMISFFMTVCYSIGHMDHSVLTV